MADKTAPVRRPPRHLPRRLLAICLLASGALMIASAARWGPAAVALFDGDGILPQFATSVPFWPLIPIALGAWLWSRT